MTYSGTKDGLTYGFYLDDTDLQNCVELTDDEHMALFDGQSTGKVIIWSEAGIPSLVDPPEPTEAELADRRISEIRRELEVIDTSTTRPLRAVLAGIGSDDDQQRLVDLENEANTLRAELQTLQGGRYGN